VKNVNKQEKQPLMEEDKFNDYCYQIEDVKQMFLFECFFVSSSVEPIIYAGTTLMSFDHLSLR